jgi:hypothetical protein
MDPRTRSRIRSLSRQRLTEEAKLLASCQDTHQLWNAKRQRVQSIARRIPSSSGRASRTAQLIYRGRAEGWLSVPALEAGH